MKNAFVIWLAVVVALGGALGGAFAGGMAIGKSQGKEAANQQLQTQFGQLASGRLRGALQGTPLAQEGTPVSAQATPQAQQGTPQAGQGTQSGLPFAGGPGGIAGRGGTVGTVEKVEGNVVTINTAQGAVRVVADNATTVQKVGEGSLRDVSAGASVTVSGERAQDGSVKATNILVSPVLRSP